MFRSTFTKDKISWKTQETITIPIKDISKLVTLEEKGIDELHVPSKDTGILVSIDFLVESEAVRFNVNLTEIVPVLKSGLVSLSRSLIAFTMGKEDRSSLSNWKLSGQGKEEILGE